MSNIIITRATRDPDFEMSETHAHEEYEIYYLVSGKCRFFIHDTLYDMHMGDFAMLRSGVFHKNSATGKDSMQKINIYLTGKQLKSLFGRHDARMRSVFDTPHIISGLDINDTVRAIMNNIENESIRRDDLSEFSTEVYVRELLVLLYRYINSDKYPKGIHSRTMTEIAARYIVEHYQSNISLEDISRYMHLSPEYFSKKFKQDTGIGFREYLVKIRLRHSVELLAETDMSITDIAFSCGFNSSNYFSNTFTKAFGTSPVRYRAARRNIV